jgi:hypothetical protein
MRTVSVSGARPGGQIFGGHVAKLPASAPRGVIGSGLLFLVSLFLLVAGADLSSLQPDPGGERQPGAFLLDPLVGPTAG